MFNLCDIHFHTNLSFDAYENVGGNKFCINDICKNYLCNDIDEDNVKLVCCTDHNIFLYDKYMQMKGEFNSNGILLLPGIEIKGEDKVHWVFIFDDSRLVLNNLGKELEKLVFTFFNYNEEEPPLAQAKKAHNSTKNVLDFTKKLIEAKIDFLAVPHLNKDNGWFEVLKKYPEQSERISYYLADGIINGFESQKMEDAILEKILVTEEYISMHSKELVDLQKKVDESENKGEKEIIQAKIDALLMQLKNEENFSRIVNKFQNIIDTNDTANVYGSDYHGTNNSSYEKEKLFYMTSQISYSGLKFALLDWYSRIFSKARKSKYSKSSNYVIKSIELNINNEKKLINLGDGLNSIIGSRGTGKSYFLSCLLGKRDDYSTSEIYKQIFINRIEFMNHAASKELNELQYDYISQKNGGGKNEKNIYELLAKAPYDFNEFKNGIEKFYTPQKKKMECIKNTFNSINELLLIYSRIDRVDNQRIDFSFIDTYNDYYENKTDDILISSMFQKLALELCKVQKEEKEKITNVSNFIENINELLEKYKMIKEYPDVKNDTSNNSLMKNDFADLIGLRDILKKETLIKMEDKCECNKKIKNITDSIIQNISKSSDNTKNILDDSISKLSSFIHQYIGLLNEAKEKRNILMGTLSNTLIDTETYIFDAETNMYDLTVCEEIKWGELSEKQLQEMLKNYNTFRNLNNDTILHIFSDDDFGKYYCENFLQNVDRRGNNINFICPSIEPNILFNKDEKKIDWKSLSPGQRSDLLLGCILTSKSSKILVIDQPEDDLDNETIFRKIVSLVRDIKLNRQIIIVTHNANLAITADSDCIIICENNNEKYNVMSDSMESRMLHSYHSINIEEKKDTIVNLACDILEGGKKAVKRRINKIGIRELLYEE